MTYILNIETTTSVCGVSLALDGKLIDSIEQKEGNAHAAKLAPFIDDLLNRNNLDYNDLNAIAISGGPGSYTGLRIGTSTAKGLCYSLEIPLISVNTLQSMAALALDTVEIAPRSILHPMIDARRMEVYTQAFDVNLQPLGSVEPLVIDNQSFEKELSQTKHYFFGDGADKCKPHIQHTNALFIDSIEASAIGMVSLSYQDYLNDRFEDVAYFEPFYLKEFVAVPSKIKGLS
jgi:tRNA threonylcarbamoyladenosine biosynthesis protein TsaB